MTKNVWISDVHDGDHDGLDVELKGWVYRARGSNKIWFMVIRDSTGIIQCVIKREEVGDECFEQLKSALIESSIKLSGVINVDERSTVGHEMDVS